MSFLLICAGFTAADITAIICGESSEGYLFGRMIPAATGLDIGGHEQRQHFLGSPPQPTRRLRPRLVPLDVYAELCCHDLELGVHLGRRSGVLFLVLHELDDGLGHRRAVKRGLVLDLHHLIPVSKERLRSPAHDLVNCGSVLSPSQPAWAFETI